MTDPKDDAYERYVELKHLRQEVVDLKRERVEIFLKSNAKYARLLKAAKEVVHNGESDGGIWVVNDAEFAALTTEVEKALKDEVKAAKKEGEK